MSELLSNGPATRPVIYRDAAANMTGETVEDCLYLHEFSKDGVVQEVQTKAAHSITEGFTERRVVAVKIRDRIYVLAYEVLSAEERRVEALVLSARNKLTPDEFDAVRSSKR